MNKAQYITRGGQVFFHNWRMFAQVNKSIGKPMFLIWLVAAVCVAFLLIPTQTLQHTGYYYAAHLWHLLKNDNKVVTIMYNGHAMRQTTLSLLSQPYFKHTALHFWWLLAISAALAFIPVMVISMLWMRLLARRGKVASEDTYVRGARLLPLKEVNRFITDASTYTLDGLRYIKDFERQHLLYHGTTGAGKSIAMTKQLLQVRRHQHKAAVVDMSGAFLSKLYRQGDVILSPFDSRSYNWDMWEDCGDAESLHALASYLIPHHPRAEPIWINAPRQIFVATAEKLRDDPERSYEKLLHIMLTLPLEEYAQYFEGTDVASIADKKIEKTVLSIRAVLASYCRPLRYLDRVSNTAPRFSLKKWLQDDNDHRWLFMVTSEEHLVAMRGLITAWVGFLANGILQLPEDVNNTRHLWLVGDEFSSLYKIAGFADALSKMRKFGGHCMIGMQSYPQLVKNYGQDEADEIIDLLNTQHFFRSMRTRIAEFASEQLGEQEIEQMRENYSYGANTIRDGISYGKQLVKRRLVLSSEISNLNNLECYVVQGGDIPSVKLRLDYKPIVNLPTVARPFMPATLVVVDNKLDELISALRFNPVTLTDDVLREVVAHTSDDVEKEVKSASKTQAKKGKGTLAPGVTQAVVREAQKVDEVVEDTPVSSKEPFEL